MQKLFGTDGIRGIAGQFPLRGSDVVSLGQAAGHVLRSKFPKQFPRVLVVRDTRTSGPSLFKSLSLGLRRQGVDVYDAGVLCTPSVAYLVKTHRFHSGVVISASHNPPEFNGIKFFTAQGRKWPDDWEHQVEQEFHTARRSVQSMLGGEIKAETFADDYEEFVISTLGLKTRFDGLRLAIDCSNGANYRTAPDVFRRLGARVHAIHLKPTGRNINVDCGSQHTASLAAVVRKKKCAVGVAFDGDGDRVIFVDEKGREIDGDYILALLTKWLKKQKRLKNNKTVITVMANLGLRKALKKMDVRSVVTPVGDRHVSAAMKTHGAVLGGEQSGHIILGDYLPTGDGLLTALHVLQAYMQEKKPFSKMVGWMTKFPQVLLNVPVKKKLPLAAMKGVLEKIADVERRLGDDGRVFVRYSGTEPLLRIMLEGPEKKELERDAADIARLVKAAQ